MKNVLLKNALIVGSLLGAAFAGSGPALAQSPVTLDSDVKVERTVVDDGVSEQVLTAPVDVVPGDKLVFETSYANNGSEVVENFVVTNPLPAAVKLAAEDASFVVSVDGGKTYAASVADLSVSSEAGRKAELADVTHIRWTLARLEPGERGSLSYQAIVR